MSKHMQSLAMALLLAMLSPQVLGAITSFPPSNSFDANQICLSKNKYNADIDAARTDGQNNGRKEAAAECIANPKTCGCLYGLKPCGVTLSSLLTGARYGETEPNDNMITADPMVPDKIYWGQSMSAMDQDWFYITTQEPNQIITLNIQVPDAANTSWTQGGGWELKVRDVAGNILAEFPFSSGEITFPVFVATPGTHYISIQPTGGWTAIPYNIIAHVDFSDSDTPPVDVNFFDVETEPNDDYSTADVLTSSVTMYGMLHSVWAGDDVKGWALQANPDWFKYTVSPDQERGEIVSLAWGQREPVLISTGREWRITIFREDGAIVTTFHTGDCTTDNNCLVAGDTGTTNTTGSGGVNNTGASKVVFIGLGKPGNYYMEVTAEVAMDASGHIITQCQKWSIPQPGGAAVCLSYVPVSTLTRATDDQYNFTWLGTRLPPITANQSAQ